jgi:FkbM family methyltransferase
LSILVLANEDVGRLIHFAGSYEPAETAFLIAQVRPGDICLDIGANVGYFSLMMARAARTGHIHAFEPIPLNAALLAASAELNGLRNIHLVRSAVGSSDGEAMFSESEDTAYSSLQDTHRKPLAKASVVPMVALDSYLVSNNLGKIDILKADVEGAEQLVVEGASRLFEDRDRRPRLVMLELFDENLSAFDTSASKVIDLMAIHGYGPHVVDDKGAVRPFVPEDLGAVYNFFFLPRE